MDLELFGRKYLTAKSLQGRAPVVATIDCVKQETIVSPQSDRPPAVKPVVYFSDPDWLRGIGLILNATNRQIGIELLGRETDTWKGRKVRINLIQTLYRGQPVEGIRLERAE